MIQGWLPVAARAADSAALAEVLPAARSAVLSRRCGTAMTSRSCFTRWCRCRYGRASIWGLSMSRTFQRIEVPLSWQMFGCLDVNLPIGKGQVHHGA